MTQILRIDSSIKADASVSRRLTDRVMARLLAAHPGAGVTVRDLSGGVPAIDGAWIGAVYTPAEARDADQARIAAYSDTLLAEVRAADILVIALPVYNFGVQLLRNNAAVAGRISDVQLLGNAGLPFALPTGYLPTPETGNTMPVQLPIMFQKAGTQVLGITVSTAAPAQTGC